MLREGWVDSPEAAFKSSFHFVVSNMLVSDMHLDFCEGLKCLFPHAVLNLCENVAKCTEEPLT